MTTSLIHFHSSVPDVSLPLTISRGLLHHVSVTIELPNVTRECHLHASISYGSILTPYSDPPRFARVARSVYFGHQFIDPNDLTHHQLTRGPDVYIESGRVDHSTTTPPHKTLVGSFDPESTIYQIHAALIVTEPGTLDGTMVKLISPTITGTVTIP